MKQKSVGGKPMVLYRRIRRKTQKPSMANEGIIRKTKHHRAVHQSLLLKIKNTDFFLRCAAFVVFNNIIRLLYWYTWIKDLSLSDGNAHSSNGFTPTLF